MIANAWKVLVLFLIPVGGGIPAGVLKARDLGFHWQFTTLLYFISDVILAMIFEPLLLFFIHLAKRNTKLKLIGEAFKQSTQRALSMYGNNVGPFALILISFGMDPMTGRSAAVAVGHGFVKGWMFAITGDMFYFGLLMVSTLWLDGFIGDGTKTTMIMIGLMLFIPWVVNRVRAKKTANPKAD